MLLDDEGNPFPPYTPDELDMMLQGHEPHEWERGRWLVTVQDLQGQVEGLRLLLKASDPMEYAPQHVKDAWASAVEHYGSEDAVVNEFLKTLKD